VTIYEGARIGKNCKIFPGAVISAVPQDLKFKGEPTQTIIGDNTVIREFVTINKGTTYSNKTSIGKDCLLMAYTHIAHDCIIGDNCVIANSVNLAGHVEIGDWAIIGGAVNIQQFTRIGAHCFISGDTSLNKDVPPFVKGARFPLSYHGVNSIGMRRRGFSQVQINHVMDIYRILFVRGYNVTKAIDIIETTLDPTPERDLILEFIKSSNIGLMKGFRSVHDKGEKR
jgi:UDP-N-acetylglucosamine acyltransferase